MALRVRVDREMVLHLEHRHFSFSRRLPHSVERSEFCTDRMAVAIPANYLTSSMLS